MRRPGEVLLVSTYELGRQPIALASPMGFLRTSGFDPDTLDLGVEQFDEARITRARFIGISVPMHTAMRLGTPILERARELNPAAHVCLYGLYASLNAGPLFDRGADSIIGGEFEGPLLELVSSLERGDDAPVAGVARPGAPAPPYLQRLRHEVPDRSTLPRLSSYAQLERDGRKEIAGSAETSRGCLHLCRHCPIPPVYGGRIFVIAGETVLEDIARQVSAGAKHITFGDPDFLNAPGHVLPIVREFPRRFPGVSYDVTTKVEHILKHRGAIPELAATGCVFLVSAVESLSHHVLQVLRKGHTRGEAMEALYVVEEAGIAFRPSLLPFTPWSTLQDFLELVEWARRHDLSEHIDPIQLSIRLLIPPGSLLLEEPSLKPHLGSLDRAAFSYEWTHPDPRMDELQRRVARLIEEATGEGTAPRETFERICDLALSFDDRRSVEPEGAPEGRDAEAAVRIVRRGKPPRLTEAWFC